ncbi:CynX/NimT family MFS transporter [Desulfitobacterium dichloroeliminans]
MMMCFALSLQALPPLFEQIMKDVPFSNSQAGILMGSYAIPGIFLPFVVAYLANRVDIKKLIIGALIIMMIGLVAFSFAGSFSLLVVFRLVAGIGATVLVVLSPLLITMYFDQKNIGIAMGIFNIAVPLGTVLAANFFGSLGRLLGWRVILVGVAGFLGVVLLLVIFALFLQKGEASTHSPDLDKKSAPRFRGSLSLWLLTAIWALANFQLIAYVTFGPQFYQSLGVSVQRAGFLTSLVMLASLFLAPLIGVAFDKTGRKKPYLIIGIALILISFVALATHFPGLPLWAFALGIGFTPIAVFAFAHIPETVRPHEVGMGMGMLTVASNLGTTVGPSAFGSILDQTQGNFTVTFMFLAAISLILIAFSLGLKSGNSRSESR